MAATNAGENKLITACKAENYHAMPLMQQQKEGWMKEKNVF